MKHEIDDRVIDIDLDDGTEEGLDPSSDSEQDSPPARKGQGNYFPPDEGVDVGEFYDDEEDGEEAEREDDDEPYSLSDDVPVVEIEKPVQTLKQRRASMNKPNKASPASSRKPGRPRKGGTATDIPKRGPGRPRKWPTPGEDDDGMRGLATFPKPAYFHFRDECSETSGKPNSFFKYWKKVHDDPGLRDRIVVYVYRNWPVLKDGRRQLDKLGEPIQMEELQLRYGAGDYHLKMNDAGMKYKTVAICTAKGFRDEANHPPVFELDALEVNDPLNKSFIERLRSRGVRVPGDPGYIGPEEKEREKESDDMAQAEVVRTVAESFENMQERMMQVVKENRPQTPVETPEAKAQMKAMDIVAQGVEFRDRMMEKVMEKMASPASEKADPIAQITAIMTLMKELRPPENTQTSEILKTMSDRMMEQEKRFHEQMFKMQSDRIEILEGQLKRRDSEERQVQAQVERPKTLVEQIKEMQEMKEVMREVLGIEEGGGSSTTSSLVDNLPTIIQGLALLGSVVVSGMHNLAILKTGQGVPVPPPGPDKILTPDQQEAVRSAGFDMPPQPNPGTPNAAYQGQPGDPNMPISPFAQYHGFVEKMRPSLLKYFQEGSSGAEYAEALIELADGGLFGPEATGRQIYDMLQEKGIELIGALIRSYPPVWNVVKETPKKWEKFLGEFFDADRILAEQEDGVAGDGIQAVPVPRRGSTGSSGTMA